MSRRNLGHRRSTFRWVSEDEAYNDGAMRTFVELFQEQHHQPDQRVKDYVDTMLYNFKYVDSVLDSVIDELVRRRIERKMKA